MVLTINKRKIVFKMYLVNNIEDLSNKVMFLLKYHYKIIEFKKKLS